MRGACWRAWRETYAIATRILYKYVDNTYFDFRISLYRRSRVRHSASKFVAAGRHSLQSVTVVEVHRSPMHFLAVSCSLSPSVRRSPVNSVTVRRGKSHPVAVIRWPSQSVARCHGVLQCVAVSHSLRAAVSHSLRVAAWCSVSHSLRVAVTV